MDFLRRLHPSAAARPDAARLVLPAWGTAAAQPMAEPAEAQAAMPPATRRADAAQDPHRAPGDGSHARSVAPTQPRRPIDTPTARAPDAARLAAPSPPAVPTNRAARGDAPGEGSMVRPSAVAPALPLPATAGSPASLPSATPPAGPLQAVPTNAAAASAVQPVGPLSGMRPPASAQPSPSPLRVETVRLAAHAAAPAPPPVLHVTIDRIDVRLPPAPAPTARPATRPRPGSAVPALGDYLRPPNGGAR